MMRILHLVNHVMDVGNGITNVCVDLAIEQSIQGHEVVVGSAGGGLAELLTFHGVSCAEIDFTSRRPDRVLAAALRLGSETRQFSPDLLHSHTITPAVLASLVARRVPSLATVHNEYQRGVSLMARADVVVGVSSAISTKLVSWGISSSRVRTVLNGPVGTYRRPSNPESIRRERPYFVAVGAISRRKGSDITFRAFCKLADRVADVDLVFVGADHFPGFKQDVASSPYSDRVSFVGFDPLPERYMSGALALILASRREPFGLVAIEAQRLGTPVIGSNVEGIPEALAFGNAGILVPLEDVDALAQAMERIAYDVELRGRLSDGARSHAVRRSTSVMATEYSAIYSEVMGVR